MSIENERVIRVGSRKSEVKLNFIKILFVLSFQSLFHSYLTLSIMILLRHSKNINRCTKLYLLTSKMLKLS